MQTLTFQTHDSLFWFQNDSNAIGVSEIYLKDIQQDYNNKITVKHSMVYSQSTQITSNFSAKKPMDFIYLPTTLNQVKQKCAEIVLIDDNFIAIVILFSTNMSHFYVNLIYCRLRLRKIHGIYLPQLICAITFFFFYIFSNRGSSHLSYDVWQCSLGIYTHAIVKRIFCISCLRNVNLF